MTKLWLRRNTHHQDESSQALSQSLAQQLVADMESVCKLIQHDLLPTHLSAGCGCLPLTVWKKPVCPQRRILMWRPGLCSYSHDGPGPALHGLPPYTLLYLTNTHTHTHLYTTLTPSIPPCIIHICSHPFTLHSCAVPLYYRTGSSCLSPSSLSLTLMHFWNFIIHY